MSHLSFYTASINSMMLYTIFRMSTVAIRWVPIEEFGRLVIRVKHVLLIVSNAEDDGRGKQRRFVASQDATYTRMDLTSTRIHLFC